MSRQLKSALTLLACAATTSLCSAELVTNGSFESNALGTDTFAAASVELTGWTVNDDDASGGNKNISLFNGTFFGANITDSVAPGTNSAYDGSQYLAFNSWQGSGLGSISQDLATVIGQEYTVSFAIAGGFPGGPHSITVDAGGINSATQSATTGAYTTHSFNFIATGNVTTLTLSDNLGAGSTTDSDLLVDAVSVTAVPEPGSLALIGLGGLCVMRRRR